jgi:hypothetical protein
VLISFLAGELTEIGVAIRLQYFIHATGPFLDIRDNVLRYALEALAAEGFTIPTIVDPGAVFVGTVDGAGAYTFTLGGASGFTMNSASGNGTLSTTGSTVSGVTNGRVYSLTVTANDTTNSTHSAALPFDVVVGSGQSSSSGNDTIRLATGSGNLGINATTPTIVYGLNGKDTIDATGMTAKVWFVGGPGADTMTGGGGVDTYLYASAGESRPGAGNFDTINGFVHGTDKIDFLALSLATGVANTNPGSFTSVNTTGLFSSHGTGTGIVVQQVGGAEQVYVDVNHDGNFNTNSDMMIHLNGITNLANTDFIV